MMCYGDSRAMQWPSGAQRCATARELTPTYSERLSSKGTLGVR